MAETRKRRRRKHRGTQGGRIDRKSRGRPRSRQEARARARGRGPRTDRPPTWRSATTRALVAAALFSVLLMAIFRQPPAQSIAFGAFMLVFYVPMGYYIDKMMWRRRQRARTREG